MREPTYNELYTNTHEGQGKTSGMRGQRPTATRQRRLQTWESAGRTERRTRSEGEVTETQIPLDFLPGRNYLGSIFGRVAFP